MIPKVPKKLCQQAIELEMLQSETKGNYNEATFAEPIHIKHVIVQPQTIYSGTNNNRQITANAVVFLFAHISHPMPKFTKYHVGSKVTYEGEVYVIQKIIDNRDPYSNSVYSYELEVL